MAGLLGKQIDPSVRIAVQHIRKARVIAEAVGEIIQPLHAGPVPGKAFQIIGKRRRQPFQQGVQPLRLLLHQADPGTADAPRAYGAPVIVHPFPGKVGRRALLKRSQHPAEHIFPHQTLHILRQSVSRQADDLRQRLRRLGSEQIHADPPVRIHIPVHMSGKRPAFLAADALQDLLQLLRISLSSVQDGKTAEHGQIFSPAEINLLIAEPVSRLLIQGKKLLIRLRHGSVHHFSGIFFHAVQILRQENLQFLFSVCHSSSLSFAAPFRDRSRILRSASAPETATDRRP